MSNLIVKQCNNCIGRKLEGDDNEMVTFGEIASDKVAETIGSWKFIIYQSCFLVLWVILNTIAWIYRWDPYPFIFLNLMLSFQAAYAAPIIQMAANRQAVKDRIMAYSDWKASQETSLKTAEILEQIKFNQESFLDFCKVEKEQSIMIKEIRDSLDETE